MQKSLSRTRVSLPASVVIRASAGTGKTYALSSRYLRLLAADVPVDHILAATFTRKAAREISERIFERLARAAAGDREELRHLRADIGSSISAASCRELLRKLVRRLHRLRIGTIDSFFVQMAGSFALELGLPPHWQIVDEWEDSALRDQAIAEMLREDAAAETETSLTTLLRLTAAGDLRSSVHNRLRREVDSLYTIFAETTEEAWHRTSRRSLPLTEADLEKAVQALEQLTDFPDKRFAKSRAKDVEQARTGDWKGFVTSGLPKAILTSGRYFNKVIPDHIRQTYKPLLDYAKAVLLNQKIDRIESLYRLLERFDEVYMRLKRRSGSYRFEDLGRLLADALQSDGRELRERVAVRLDAEIRHLLLDEFQDTSLQQWRVIRPFALAGAESNNGSFFCVGDAKQAIYGWRGGVSEIFDAVVEELPNVEQQPLDSNWRSSPVIIETVNQLFGSLDKNAVLADYPEVVQHWQQRFRKHRAARLDLKGYCELTCAPSAGGTEKQTDATLDWAADQAADLARRHPNREVGVLAPTNDAVARLIFRLRTEHPDVPAVEASGGRLTDSLAVAAILSLLQLADHPSDTVARFHVAHSPLGRVVGLEEKQYQDDERCWQLAADLRRLLLEQGYGATLHRWAAELAPECDERELSRLKQLIAMAYRWDQSPTLRPSDFIRFVENQRVEPPSVARLRVMTIHQSKGLEFDIVVLTGLDRDLTGRRPTVVTGRRHPCAPIDHVFPYVSRELLPIMPESVVQLVRRWEIAQINESLCVLYVAMTRAVHALHIVVGPSGDGSSGGSRSRGKNQSKTFAALLQFGLADGRPSVPQQPAYRNGDPNWDDLATQIEEPQLCLASETAGDQSDLGGQAAAAGSGSQRTVAADARPAATDKSADQTEAPTPLLSIPKKPQRLLPRRAPSRAGELAERVHIAQALSDAGPGAARGTVLHAWFGQIGWLDEMDCPDEQTLRQIAHTLSLGSIDLGSLLTEFREMLQDQRIRRVLSKVSYRQIDEHVLGQQLTQLLASGFDGMELFREHPLLVRIDNTLVDATIDRLVVFYKDDQPVAADILDFKSDSVEDEPRALKEAVERHRPQMMLYRDAVSRAFGIPAANVATRLLFLQPRRVCCVRPS